MNILSEYSLPMAAQMLTALGFRYFTLVRGLDWRMEYFFWHPCLHDADEGLHRLGYRGTYLAREMERQGKGFILFYDGSDREQSRQTLLQNRRVLEEQADLINACRVLSVCS